MSVFFLHHIETMSRLFDEIEQYGFCVLENVYPLAYLQQLKTEYFAHFNQFKAASIQNGVITTIRSDYILWIDESYPIANQHLQMLQSLSEQLNQAFFFGLENIEAHFACYEAGEFYALHRDNPQQKNERVISTVFYLHDTWQADYGGELRLQDKHGGWHLILPQSNQLVVFQSDLLHEVLVTQQQRLSLTAWLRQRPNSILTI